MSTRPLQAAWAGVIGGLWGGAVRAAEQQPALGPDANAFSHLVQLVVGLVVVVVAIVGVGWLLKRFNRFTQTAGGSVRIIGGLSMGPRERVVLVQVGDEQLLLGVAPGRVQTLHVLAQPVEMHTASTAPERFSDRLKAAMRGGQAQ